MIHNVCEDAACKHDVYQDDVCEDDVCEHDVCEHGVCKDDICEDDVYEHDVCESMMMMCVHDDDVCVCVRDGTGAGRERDGRADTALKTKTPHNNVGK